MTRPAAGAAPQRVTVNGVDTRYRLDGTGETVALVHGVGSRLEAWDGVVARLQDRYRLLRYDLRGHGESAKPSGPYTVDDFVADLRGLLDALTIERCHVAGFSLGGLIAQGFALTHPASLDRLVLLSTVAGRTPEEQARVAERLDIVASGIPGGHFQRSVERWFTDAFRRDHPDLIDSLAALNAANDPDGYAASYRVLALTDLADRLGAITAPTLVVTGEHDQGSNPRMARLMHARIAGSTLRILPGLRHSILIEAPDVVAGLLGDFLAGSLPR